MQRTISCSYWYDTRASYHRNLASASAWWQVTSFDTIELSQASLPQSQRKQRKLVAPGRRVQRFTEPSSASRETSLGSVARLTTRAVAGTAATSKSNGEWSLVYTSVARLSRSHQFHGHATVHWRNQLRSFKMFWFCWRTSKNSRRNVKSKC